MMQRPDLVTCTVDSELVILDRAGGYVHQLNATASEIWSACDGVRGAEDIAALVGARFDDPPSTVLQDVLSTLQELRRLGLLVDQSGDER
jgi:hypothetical protein